MTVLSGAGISAESGVATFRDAQTGLWEMFDPEELASPQAWQRQPDVVWAWYLWRHHLVNSVEPNAGHHAVADWQNHAEVRVITQNVDNLHERAGSKHVAHLHGSLFDFRCSRCSSQYHDELAGLPEPVQALAPPHVGAADRYDPAWCGLARRCRTSPGSRPSRRWHRPDVVVVVGTSGIVYPAAGLPSAALAQGIPVIEVNPDETPLSSSVTATIRDTAGNALPGLLDQLDDLIS